MPHDSDDVLDVPGQLQTAQNLPPNLMLLKMENDSMMAAAVMRPRSPAKIVKQLVELIEAFPASADDAIYSKPVGKVKRIECGDCGNTYEVPARRNTFECTKCGSKRQPKSVSRDIQKFAEGLSIRAAESVRSIFGYTRLATTTEMLENGSAKITGIFVDYAAGNITSDERIISPYYTGYGGKKETIPQDRFENLTVKAEKSKLRRDIILDSVPNEVKAAFIDACEKKLAAMVTPEKVEKEILPWFASRGVTQEHLEKLIGRPLKLGWTEEDRLQLKKIASALKNEEMTVAELLKDIDGGTADAGGKVGESSVGDKFGKGKKPEAETGEQGAGNAPATEQAKSANETQQQQQTETTGPVDAGDDPLLPWQAMIDEAENDVDLNAINELLTKSESLNSNQKSAVLKWLGDRRKAVGTPKKGKKGNDGELFPTNPNTGA